MSLSRQQFTLIGIFALFMGPVLLVILMRSSWWQYQPSGMKNQGYLVQPPVHISLEQTKSIKDKWVVLYVLDQPCEQACIDNVTAIRQIHRAAGRRAGQLAIVLLSEAPMEPALRSKLVSIYPEFSIVEEPTESVLTTLSTVNDAMMLESPGSNNVRTYILDPMLNTILAYGTDTNPGDLHKDLKRLLKWSDQEGTK
jgi:hypothetical protein